MFCILIVVVFVCLYTLGKIHRPVHLERANFTVYKLYLNMPDCKQKRVGVTKSGMSRALQI